MSDMQKPRKRDRLSFRLTGELRKQLEIAAAKQRITVGQFIRECIARCVLA